jgi:hypothetical protein
VPAPGYLALRADSRSAGVCSVKRRRVSAIRDRSLTMKLDMGQVPGAPGRGADGGRRDVA